LCAMPMHITVFSVYVLVGLIRQTIGHLGYEVFPKQAGKGWLSWNTTVTHHDMHHEKINYNFALYFMFWDKVMNTLHPDYYKRFDKVQPEKCKKEQLLKS